MQAKRVHGSRRVLGALSVVVMTAAAVMVGIGARPAGAVTGSSRGEVLIDETGGHVFVTALDSVAVYDMSGNPVASIPGQSGASDLLLRGRTLYVSSTSASRINAIDADTFAVTGGWSLASTPRPRAMAWSAGRIWFTYEHQWSGGLASLDPATGSISGPLATNLYGQGEIAASDSPARVYVLDTGLSPSKIHAYDVTTDPPTPVGESPHSNACSNGSEVVLSADAATAWTACGSPYGFSEFDTTTLAEPAVRYQANPYPVAVDLSADGRFLIGGTWSPYQPDVHAYEVGNTTAIRTYELGPNTRLANGMLAISRDGSRVFAVTETGVLHTWSLSPQVSSIEPSVVPIRKHAEVVINGSGFTGLSEVTVGGTATDFVVVDDTEVRVTTPRLFRGTHAVVLTGPSGSNDASEAATVTASNNVRKFAESSATS